METYDEMETTNQDVYLTPEMPESLDIKFDGEHTYCTNTIDPPTLVNSYLCNICGKGFKTVTRFRNHMRLHYTLGIAAPNAAANSIPNAAAHAAAIAAAAHAAPNTVANAAPKSIANAAAKSVASVAPNSAVDATANADANTVLIAAANIVPNADVNTDLIENQYESSFVDQPADEDCDSSEQQFPIADGRRRHTDPTLVRQCKENDSIARALHKLAEVTNEEFVEYTCAVCDRSFGSTRALKRHVAWHQAARDPLQPIEGLKSSSNKSCTCEMCGRVFSTPWNMKKHASFYCSGAPVKELPADDAAETDGDQISAVLSNSQSENETSHTEMDTSDAKCSICDKVFHNYRGMRIHVNKAHTKPMKLEDSNQETIQYSNRNHFKCKYCHRVFPNVKSMASHMKMHFVRRSSEDSNLATEIKKEIFQEVPESNSGFSSRNHSPEPENVITSSTPVEDASKPFACRLCGKRFSVGRSLGGHMRAHLFQTRPADSTPAVESPSSRDVNTSSDQSLNDSFRFACRVCHRRFATAVGLGGHMKAHRPKFVAPNTGKHSLDEKAMRVKVEDVNAASFRGFQRPSFSKRRKLRSHLNALEKSEATSKRAVVISPAGQNDTSVAADRSAASPTHDEDEFSDQRDSTSGERDKIFVQSSDGREEQFEFEDRKAEGYKCVECGEIYLDKLQMIVHVSHHVVKRTANGCQRTITIRADPMIFAPYKCRYCGERFINKQYHFAHVSKHHTNDVFDCNLCQSCP